ncbi:Uncharacterized protein GBIM_13723 [Gryllus bimaculatus]|nr:Uncharacterized protein GBIM_13723 [Gryllus bimaculatus]
MRKAERAVGEKGVYGEGRNGEHAATFGGLTVPVPVLAWGVARSMTLTRGPCELDTMSLFQDLKLKRRKVDSRCSSDGE